MNKPVAYVNSMCSDYIDWKVDPMSIDGQSLYTHPVKELTELDYAEFLPIWKDFIKEVGSVLNVQMVAHHFYNLALRKAQEKCTK